MDYGIGDRIAVKTERDAEGGYVVVGVIEDKFQAPFTGAEVYVVGGVGYYEWQVVGQAPETLFP